MGYTLAFIVFYCSGRKTYVKGHCLNMLLLLTYQMPGTSTFFFCRTFGVGFALPTATSGFPSASTHVYCSSRLVFMNAHLMPVSRNLQLLRLATYRLHIRARNTMRGINDTNS